MKLEVITSQARSAREMLGVNWANAIFLIVAHLAAVAALFFTSWTAVITAVVLYWIGGSLGIGMGYHRLLTHRGYKVPKLVEYFLAICGTMALEGGPIQWVVTHRIHHAHADRPGDPHTHHAMAVGGRT
jgi:stearoyl-CoA desaturase (delta-9 desaturase)